MAGFPCHCGSFGRIQPNPHQTQISDITLENIDVQLKNSKLKAQGVKNLQIKNITVNGKPCAVDKQ